jgi:hypothetical protein
LPAHYLTTTTMSAQMQVNRPAHNMDEENRGVNWPYLYQPHVCTICTQHSKAENEWVQCPSSSTPSGKHKHKPVDLHKTLMSANWPCLCHFPIKWTDAVYNTCYCPHTTSNMIPLALAISAVDILNPGSCKGTSVCFLTSHILSHSPHVHIYSPS